MKDKAVSSRCHTLTILSVSAMYRNKGISCFYLDLTERPTIRMDPVERPAIRVTYHSHGAGFIQIGHSHRHCGATGRSCGYGHSQGNSTSIGSAIRVDTDHSCNGAFAWDRLFIWNLDWPFAYTLLRDRPFAWTRSFARGLNLSGIGHSCGPSRPTGHWGN